MYEQEAAAATGGNGKKIVLIIVIILIVGAVAFGAFWFIKKQSTNKANNVSGVATTSASTTSIVETPRLGGNGLGLDGGLDIIKATSSHGIEYLTFADFYKAPDNSLNVNINDYNLPINVKTDVLNYYDVSRKLNLDPSLNSLNNYGLVAMANPFKKDVKVKDSKDIKDFYGIYEILNKKQIPLLITSDFITYYYQNILKKVFKEIETNVFYSNLWDIYYDLYDIAKSRYDERLAAVGNINDSILEAQRLELAYLATTLEILKPANGQINTDLKNIDKNKFITQEVNDYSFNIPSYLRVDVLREVELIRAQKETFKSPVLLYSRDYREFKVPDEYKTNAKLNNFYLATRWLNSNWPLVSRSSDCADCLLDSEDNKINTIAAAYLAQDLFNNEDLKTRWARIYKVLTYFKGVRSDLSLVNYRDALTEVFGLDYKLDEVFSDQNKMAGINLNKLRARLLEYDFKLSEGAYDKNNPSHKNHLGVKVLAESYWPNEYLFSRLTSPNVSFYQSPKIAKTNITACRLQDELSRCSGFGMDIVNLIHPLADPNDYFKENTSYVNYDEKVAELRNELNSFSNNTWYFNNYWATLKTLKSSLDYSRSQMPLYARNQNYDNREINRTLSSWVNLQLPLDQLGLPPKASQAENITTGSFNYLEHAYVEPNLALINEMIANVNMINEMMTALKVNSSVKSVSMSLSDLGNNLLNLKSIVEKEMQGQAVSETDYQFIDRLAKEFKVEVFGARSLKIITGGKISLVEDLSDIKLLSLVYKKGNELILTVGPIFNYWEKK